MLLLTVAAALVLALAIPVVARAEDGPSPAGPAGAEPAGTGDEALPSPSGDAADGDAEDEGEDEQPEQSAVEVTWWFLKTDDSSAPLAGAQMELRGASGEVLFSFETGDEETELTQTLALGETYTLHEVAAPAGFALADDLTFVVELDEDGEPCVVAQDGDVRSKDDSTLVMVDEPVPASEDPTDPEDPDEPEEPEEPTNPEEPQDPEEPTDPTEPVEPEDPSPREPADPTTPKETPKAVEPAAPTAPSPVAPSATPQAKAPAAQATRASATPAEASSPSDGLPQTGDEASPLVALLPVAGACALGVGLWKKLMRR